MILPIIKFTVFTLASFLLLLWLASPNLWLRLSSLARLVSDDPSSLLFFLGGLLTFEEAIVKSLTCDNLDFYSSESILSAPGAKVPPLSPPWMPDDKDSVPLQEMEILSSVTSYAPWLVAGFALMGLNSYFPQLSPVSFLWSPLRAAVPVIHWVASCPPLLHTITTHRINLALSLATALLFAVSPPKTEEYIEPICQLVHLQNVFLIS
ncbi:hypothetical protein DSO57_1035711 [Entomophthora muscae]|uniref:Uncharacterized protein n=1 Tax=Entomophthora muscae TaxID=34485 RepID=A0ACC2RE99_9FUNG|nr:hypothetical protein DSO57_1035711 [Entomophthora muscae]